MVAARVAVPRWDTFPCLRKPTVSDSLWGRTVVGRVTGGSVQSHQQPPVGRGTFLSGPRLSVAPAHPQGACVARGGAAARPCLWEAVATPLGGSAPRTSLSKTPSAESSSSSQGFEPSSATTQSGGNAGTEVMLLRNGPLRSGRDISGRAGAAPRSRGRSSAVHHHRSRTLLWTVHLQLLHVLPWQNSWDGKQPLCLCAGVQGTEQCEIIQPFLRAAVGC